MKNQHHWLTSKTFLTKYQLPATSGLRPEQATIAQEVAFKCKLSAAFFSDKPRCVCRDNIALFSPDRLVDSLLRRWRFTGLDAIALWSDGEPVVTPGQELDADEIQQLSTFERTD